MEKIKAGQKVKVHLGVLGSCYGITTGRSVKRVLRFAMQTRCKYTRMSKRYFQRENF